MLGSGLAGVALWSLNRDDEELATYVAAALAGGTVLGALGWAWYRTSRGPPHPTETPSPAKGSVAAVDTQLEPGPGYIVRKPARSWGQEWVIPRLQAAAAAYQGDCPGAPDLRVGDLSRLGGGPFPPHKSHQWGTDVDIGLPLGVDRQACLARAFLADPRVEFIFVDQAVITAMGNVAPDVAEQSGKRKRLRHWPGHRDHFHVRWRRD